jgi:GDPmannose 4,6-dehydratase
MWLMLQQDAPDDYVIASGRTHSVRDFCEAAFSRLDLDYNEFVVVDPEFFRPVDVNALCGDPTKAHSVLGWGPRVSFEELVAMMVDADMARLGGSGLCL